MSKLTDYQILSTGLTHQDVAFRDALAELSGENVDFYTYQTSARNRLNHALVHHQLDLDSPVNVVGLVDFEDGKLYMSKWGTETEYNLDDLDPRYVATINQLSNYTGRRPSQLPITDIAATMLDELHEDVDIESKPDVEESSLSGSRKVLERAFANEMVFQVALEEYIKDKKLDTVFALHSDEFDDLINKSSFEASFNDGLDELSAKIIKPEVEANVNEL